MLGKENGVLGNQGPFVLFSGTAPHEITLKRSNRFENFRRGSKDREEVKRHRL
jgi:hypothetical protein